MSKIDKDTDLVIVVGHQKSSNSNRLFEIAKNTFKDATVIMVNDLSELKEHNIESKKKAAIVSGASTPQFVVDDIYNYLLSK